MAISLSCTVLIATVVLLHGAAFAHPVRSAAELAPLAGFAHGEQSPASVVLARAWTHLAAIPRSAAQLLRISLLETFAGWAPATAAKQAVFSRAIAVTLTVPEEQLRSKVVRASLSADGWSLHVHFKDSSGRGTGHETVLLADRGSVNQSISITTRQGNRSDIDYARVGSAVRRLVSLFPETFGRAWTSQIGKSSLVVLVPLASASAADALEACQAVGTRNSRFRARCYARIAAQLCLNKFPAGTCKSDADAETCWLDAVHRCSSSARPGCGRSNARDVLMSCAFTLARLVLCAIFSAVSVVMLGLGLCTLSFAWSSFSAFNEKFATSVCSAARQYFAKERETSASLDACIYPFDRVPVETA
jgi:hypothetical protein